jgi:hypothetical protein
MACFSWRTGFRYASTLLLLIAAGLPLWAQGPRNDSSAPIPLHIPPRRSSQIHDGFGINSDLPRKPWMPHHLFLGSRKDVDDIAAAVEKVCANVDELRGLRHPAIEKGAMSRVERPRIERRQY